MRDVRPKQYPLETSESNEKMINRLAFEGHRFSVCGYRGSIAH